MTTKELNAELFQLLEEKLHSPYIRSSRQAVGELLADDFIEFGSSGRVFNKLATVEALATEATSGTPREVSDFAIKILAADAVVVMYRSRRGLAAASGSSQTLRSSIWKLIDGRWQLLFHQGTRIPPE